MKKSALILGFLIFGFLISSKSALAGPCLHNGGTDCCDKGNASSQTYNPSNGYCSNACAGTCYYEVNAGNYQTVACYPPSPFSYTAVSPATGSTTANLIPSFSWTTNNCSANGSSTTMGIFSGSNCQGSYIKMTTSPLAAGAISANYSQLVPSTPLLEGASYSWNVYGLTPNGTFKTSNCNNFTTPIRPPTIAGSNITISPAALTPTTQATITIKASDLDGAADVDNVYALINAANVTGAGTNPGMFHGYLGWSNAGNFPNWGGNFKFNPISAVTGGGKCGIYNGNGQRYISNSNFSCQTNISGTNERTVTFTFYFDSSFIVPATNTVSALASDTSGFWSNNDAWTQSLTNFSFSNSACQVPTGLTGWWRMDDGSPLPSAWLSTVSDSAGPNDGTAKNDNYLSSNLVSYWKLDGNGTDSVTASSNHGTQNGTSCSLNSTILNDALVSYWKGDETTNAPTNSGLAGYWKLDEASVGPALDSSGNNNTGTSNGTTVTAGKINTSRTFNGSGDSITTSFTPSNIFTMSLWYYANTTQASNAGLFSTYSGGTYTGIYYSFLNGFEYLWYNGNANQTTTQSLNQWVHLAIVSDGTNISWYKNGALVKPAFAGATTHAGPLFIGDSKYNGRYFNGSMDEVRVYNTALSASQITDLYSQPGGFADAQGPNNGTGSGLGCNFNAGENYNNNLSASIYNYWKLDEPAGASSFADSLGINIGSPNSSTTLTFNPNIGNLTNGLVGYWKMDETAGATVITDSVGTANAGAQWTSPPTPNAAGAAALTNKAWSFPGNGTAGVGSSPTTNLTNWTMATWFNANSTAGEQIFTFNGAASHGYGIGIGYGKVSAIAPYTTNYIAQDTSTFSPATGTWYHLVVVNNGGNVSFYVNGQFKSTVNNFAQGNGGIFGGYVRFSLGANYNSAGNGFERGFNGKLDESAIWNRVLNAQEILDLYNSGSGNPYRTLPGISPAIPGQINNGQAFNGSNNYIRTTFPATASANFTVSAWIKRTKLNTTGLTDDNNWAASVGNWWSSFDPSGNLQVYLTGTGAWKSTGLSVPVDPNYHFVSFVISNGNTLTGYVDGNIGTGIPITNNFPAAVNPLWLGGRSDLARFFGGSIDEVAIWNRALNSTEIAQIRNAGAGLACDAGPVAVTNTGRTGRSFGGNDQISIADSATNRFTNTLSVSAWVYPKDYAHAGNNANPIIVKEGQFLINLRSDKKIQAWVNIGNTWISDVASTTDLPLNTWSFLTLTWDGTTLKTYVNASQIGSGVSASGILSASTSPILLGYRTPFKTFNGYIDEVGLWAKPLTGGFAGSDISNLIATSTCNQPPGGPILSSTGKINTGMNFNNKDNYVLVNDSSSLDIANNLTISAWIKPNFVTGPANIVAKRNATIGNYGFRVYNGQLEFYYFSNNAWQFYTTNNANLTPNTWYNAVATFNGTPSIYLNGTLLTGSCTGGSCNFPLVSDTTNLVLGRAGDNPGGYYSGTIDEVGIWSRVLTQTDVTNLYGGGNGVVYDTMDSQGPLIVGPPGSPNYYSVLGDARSFNGAGDYISAPDNPAITPTGNYTIEAFVKSSSTSNYQNIVTKFQTGGNYPGYLLAVGDGTAPRTGKLALWVGDLAKGWIVGTKTINDGAWHHVAGVLSGTTVQLYVDGETDGSLVTSVNPNRANTQPLYIGRRYDSQSGFFTGSIDEVRVYNTALTANQILAEAKPDKVTLQPNTCGACLGTCIQGGPQPTKDCANNYCGIAKVDCSPQGNIVITGYVTNPPAVDIANGSLVCDKYGGGGSCTLTSGITTSYLGSNGDYRYQFTTTTIGDHKISLNSSVSHTPDDYTVNASCLNLDAAGPRFWYNSAVGIPSGTNNFALITNSVFGSGHPSADGLPPSGYYLENYINSAPISKVNYATFLNQVLLGLADINNYTFYTYTDAATFATQLTTALGNATNRTIVLYPATGTPTTNITMSTPKTITNKIMIFVNGNLTISTSATPTVTVASIDTAGAMFVLTGNLTLDKTVTRLDGIYVFPGTFADGTAGSNDQKLVGYGSLIATGTAPLGFERRIDNALGEEWHYEPKYISLFNNIISSPRFVWKELPPQ